MTKQILKTVYELDEVKDKAIEKNRFINVEFDDWHDILILEWKEKLEKAGFENPKIYFSGFCSQSDGACFDCNSLDVSRLLKNLDFTDAQKARILEIQDDFSVSIEKNGYSNHYSHEKTRYICSDSFHIEDVKDEKMLEVFFWEIEKIRLDFCYKIYRDLNEEYDYLTSDSAVYDTLKANEYYFEESGEIAR